MSRAYPSPGVLSDAGRTIGRMHADLCNCLNTAAIILGGELVTASDPLVAGVRESIDRYAEPATSAAVNILTAQLGTRAELLGATAAGTTPRHRSPSRLARSMPRHCGRPRPRHLRNSMGNAFGMLNILRARTNPHGLGVN